MSNSTHKISSLSSSQSSLHSSFSSQNFLLLCAANNLPLAQEKFLSAPQDCNLSLALYQAARFNAYDVFLWLDSLNKVDIREDNDFLFRRIAGDGHLDLTKYLLKKYPIKVAVENHEAFRDAASAGKLEMIIFLESKTRINYQADNNHAFKYSAYNGHLKVVDYLYQKEPKILENIDLNEFLIWLIYYDQIDILIWSEGKIKINYGEISERVFMEGKRRQNKRAIEWFVGRLRN